MHAPPWSHACIALTKKTKQQTPELLLVWAPMIKPKQGRSSQLWLHRFVHYHLESEQKKAARFENIFSVIYRDLKFSLAKSSANDDVQHYQPVTTLSSQSILALQSWFSFHTLANTRDQQGTQEALTKIEFWVSYGVSKLQSIVPKRTPRPVRVQQPVPAQFQPSQSNLASTPWLLSIQANEENINFCSRVLDIQS